MSAVDPNFQVETRLDSDAYLNIVTVHYMLHQKSSIRALYVLGVGLAVCIWFLAARGNYAGLSALGAGLFSLAVILLLVPYWDRFAARRVCRRMHRGAVRAAEKSRIYLLPVRYRFYDGHMDISDRTGRVELPYQKVTDLVETAGYFLVFYSGNTMCIPARKRDFTTGDCREFGPFLEARCNRKPVFFDLSRPSGR